MFKLIALITILSISTTSQNINEIGNIPLQISECYMKAEAEVEKCMLLSKSMESEISKLDQEVLNNHPQDLPESDKKMLCCYGLKMKDCIIAAFKDYPDCQRVYLEYVINFEHYEQTCIPKYQTMESC